MLLTAGVLIYVNHMENTRRFYTFLAVSYGVGFLVEVAGINTGVIFGEYEYGDVLGWKTWGTPWTIGVNWFIVTYVVNQWVMDWKLTRIMHAVVSGLVVTGLDYIIEPVAIELGMWTWEQASIPVRNYVAWFVVSGALSYFYHAQNLPAKQISKVVFVVMVLFFIL
jgi:putative membrane protein